MCCFVSSGSRYYVRLASKASASAAVSGSDARSIVMKTSVIRYRVADFLKQYPPFNELSAEDLLVLAASGRVVFHESEEYIFRKNQPKTSSICVIQQGSVE